MYILRALAEVILAGRHAIGYVLQQVLRQENRLHISGMIQDRLGDHRNAITSATDTLGFRERALRNVRSRETSRNPALRNSSRRAPPSFAPATQVNQFAAPARSSAARASTTTSSAA